MKTSKTTKTAARAIGVILILTGMVYAQLDTFKITCKFMGDIGTNSFTVKATPISAFPGTGGSLSFVSNSTNSVTFRNLPVFWTGKVSVALSSGNYGFTITPPLDTQVLDIMSDITFTVTVQDTSRPEVKIGHLSGTTLNVNEPFTFYDSIMENTKNVNIRHDYSFDSGKTWDSICYQQGVPVSYLSYTGLLQTFTPTVASDNFMLRAIVTDRFHALADTDIVTLKVKDQVNIRTEKKPVSFKIYKKNMISYDLLGRVQSTPSRGARQISKYTISYDNHGRILIK
jgi:cytochrome c oxidase assembly protein Cox11